MPSETDQTRRKLLSAAAITGGSLLAGCLGDGSGDGSEDGEGDDGSRGDRSEDGQDGTEGDDEFPTKEMQILIPYGPGGGYDEYVRLFAQHAEKYVPDDVAIQPRNVEGADGQIATTETYDAEPDGHTTMLVNVGNFVQQQILYDVDFDLREMTWLPQITTNTPAIAAGTNTDIESWDELVERTREGAVNWTTSGGATATGVVGATLTGVLADLYEPGDVLDNLVTFDSRGNAVQSIMSGDAQVMPGTYDSLLPYVDSDDLRIVMTLSTDDPPEQTPDSGTLATEDVDDAEEIEDAASAPRIFAGPPDIPAPRASSVRELFDTVINDEEFRAAVEEVDRSIVYEDSERAEQIVTNTFETWEQQEDLLRTIAGEE